MRAAKTAKRGYLGRGGFNALTGLTAEPTAAWRRKSSWYRNETKRDKRKKKNVRKLFPARIICYFNENFLTVCASLIFYPQARVHCTSWTIRMFRRYADDSPTFRCAETNLNKHTSRFVTIFCALAPRQMIEPYSMRACVHCFGNCNRRITSERRLRHFCCTT